MDIKQSRANALIGYVPLALIIIVAVIGLVALRDVLSFRALQENREALLALRDQNYAGAVAVFMTCYILVVVLSIPGAVFLTLAGGFMFGVFPGVLFNAVAATIGATMIFLIARFGGGKRIGARLEASEGTVKKIKDGIDENQWSVLFLIRLVPAVPFFIANIVPALVEVPLHRFVVSTFFGILPGGLVYTALGASLGEVFARGETPDLGIIFEPHILMPILGLCLLAVLPMVLKPVMRARGVSDE